MVQVLVFRRKSWGRDCKLSHWPSRPYSDSHTSWCIMQNKIAWIAPIVLHEVTRLAAGVLVKLVRDSFQVVAGGKYEFVEVDRT